jgi:hypothetical protein
LLDHHRASEQTRVEPDAASALQEDTSGLVSRDFRKSRLASVFEPSRNWGFLHLAMSEMDDVERVKAACRVLGEHFDCVQIFASRHEDKYESDGTVNVAYGDGNWFARYGQVVEWMIRQDERTRDHIREENKRDRE